MSEPPKPTLTFDAVQQILGEERGASDADRKRLQTVIDQLVGERAILAAERDRLRDELQRAQSCARQWQLLQAGRTNLAEYLADQIEVRLETYQEDGAGRFALCMETDEITVDLTEDDYIPATLVVAKPLSDTDTARFHCRLQAEALRYTIEYRQ